MPEKKNRILILADDLTGALDSGVQLSSRGTRTVVLPDSRAAFQDGEDACDAVIVDTESRHIAPQEAARIVTEMVQKAQGRGISYIYKKTDSGLRGNVGVELAAACSAAGRKQIHYVPAYPDADRKTRDGIQYVNGRPLAESIFAKDPIEPMTKSRVDEILREQTDMEVHLIPLEALRRNPLLAGQNGILVYDAETNEDLKVIAEILHGLDELHLTAGCAGFLEYSAMDIPKGKLPELPDLPKKLLVVSGSQNAVTRQQLLEAQKCRAVREHVPVARILRGTWTQAEQAAFAACMLRQLKTSGIGIIDTFAETPEPLSDGHSGNPNAAGTIAREMGNLLRVLYDSSQDVTFMIIGGDTLQEFIRALQIQRLYPIAQIDTGVVLAEFHYGGRTRYIITKSGAFGPEDLVIRLHRWLDDRQ